MGNFPLRLVTTVAILAIGLSCAGPPDEPTETEGVSNIDLAVSLASVPADLVVARNDGPHLELRPSDDGATGMIWFTVSPESQAINLVQAVNDHHFAIEGMSDGDYLGAQELTGDFGSAFYSRGRFSEGEAVLEETVIVALHPVGNRLLTIHSRYPAGDDSAARVEQLIGVLAEIEW